jgi:hypothetical protein
MAGVAVGILSVAVARQVTDTSEREELAFAFGHRITTRKTRRVGRLAKSAA